MTPQKAKAPVLTYRSLQNSKPLQKGSNMLSRIAEKPEFIKAKEYLAACDALGFHYSINEKGQLWFQEGENWTAFLALVTQFGKPFTSALQSLCGQLGRFDPPSEKYRGPWLCLKQQPNGEFVETHCTLGVAA